MTNVLKLEPTIVCPKTNKRLGLGKCNGCAYYDGAYGNWTIECWYGIDQFDLALLKLVWNDDADRKQLPKACRPFEAPTCRHCDKFATGKCYARIQRMRGYQ